MLAWIRRLVFDEKRSELRFLRPAEGTHLVGLSHCVVRVMWFKYWIRPDAVLLSSQLAAETYTDPAVSRDTATSHTYIRSALMSLCLCLQCVTEEISLFYSPVWKIIVKQATAVHHGTSRAYAVPRLQTHFRNTWQTDANTSVSRQKIPARAQIFHYKDSQTESFYTGKK